jgi:hypothetical protein
MLKKLKGGHKMAEQADVYVKNNLVGDITVARKLPDGSSDLNITVTNGNTEQVYLAGTNISLVIHAPEGVDTKEYSLGVRSGLDLAVTHSRTGSNWAIKIIPNDLPPEVPTTVNVNIGENPPT